MHNGACSFLKKEFQIKKKIAIRFKMAGEETALSGLIKMIYTNDKCQSLKKNKILIEIKEVIYNVIYITNN